MACLRDPFFRIVHAVKELWTQSILPYNLPFTVLLGLVVVFWLLSLLGALGVDALDGDLDVPHADDPTSIGDLPGAFLRVVNAGSVPVTIVLSILVLAMWIGMILFNYHFNPGQSMWIAVAFAGASFVAGVIATKIITQPLVPFMKRLKEAEDAPPVIGEMGVVRSIEIDSTFGQVEVHRRDGAPALLNAKLGPDMEPVPRGTEVAVISLDETSGVYLVRPVSTAPAI